jgi:hypothetical protein
MMSQNTKYLSELRLGDEKTLNQKVDLRVFSLGAGVQSSYILFQMLEGKIKAPDVALFADTGNEPKEVYDWLKKLIKISKNKIDIEIVKNNQNTGNIINDYKAKEGRYALIPTHILKEDGTAGFGRRTCTYEYKIKPIQQKVREVLGVNNLRGKCVEMVMGISIDEIQRAKKPPTKWQISCYPLIENNISRSQILHYMEHSNYGTAPRSACIVCPFHDNSEWKRLKENHPEEFEYAVQFDEWLRDENSNSVGINNFRKGNSKSEQYLYRKKIPLRDANFDEPKDYQYSLFDDECEGMCGV